MSGTYRGSISIEIPERGEDPGVQRVRWARVDLEDFFWIGRVSICNLKIQGDTQVSRLHATIHREGGHYLLTDMQSRNGTAVNGRRTTAMRLAPGDRVRVGQTLFEFEPEQREDTYFREGTSRVIGSADVELKSFPSSIQITDEVLVGAIQERAAMSLVAMPHASSLDEFLTIVIDRVVCELQAGLGVIHVPRIGARASITHARGMRDGRLEVLALPTEVITRVVHQLQPVLPGEPVPEDGERLLWNGADLEQRLGPKDKAPRSLVPGWGFTIAMPGVGRMGTRGPLDETTDGLAYIHVADAQLTRNVARLIDEVAAAVNVSAIRFLERLG